MQRAMTIARPGSKNYALPQIWVGHLILLQVVSTKGMMPTSV
jgi:hypothetical protein